MRRKNNKVREVALNGARINSVCISKLTKDKCVSGDSLNNIREYIFTEEQETYCFNGSSSNTVQSEVSAVSYDTDEKRIYAGSNRGIIHIWDIDQGKQINLLKGHSTSVNCFGIFPDNNNRMASGSYDTNIKLWDIRDKNNYATLKGHNKQINSIDISPDSTMLVSGSQDNSCKIWDLRYPQKLINTYNDHTAPVIKVLFHPDDMMFASAAMDKTAKYYKCQAPNHYHYVSSTDMIAVPVTAIAFDEKGSVMYTAANDTLKVWNMAKGGLLVETIESPWKGVQEICWTEDGVLGVAASPHYLSFWAFDFNQKLIKKPMEKKESESVVFPNINKKKDVKKDLLQAMNNINEVMGVVNNIQKQKRQKVQQRQQQMTEEDKQKIAEEQRLKAEEQRLKAEKLQQQKLEKQRKKEEQLKKQREERERMEAMRKQQEKKRLQQMEKERIERQRVLQQRIHDTFDQQGPNELQNSMHPDCLQSSAVMNLSQFMIDGAQKEKLKQIELISGMMKDNSTFETVMKSRINQLKPIIHFWSQGKTESSLSILKQAQAPIVSDAMTAILKSSKMRYAVSPQIAVKLLIILTQLMKNKHGTYFRSAMLSINQIINMFKQQLIKIKTFNPMTKNDPAREERLAKYDRLIEEFLNVFKQERLKKYALGKSKGENVELVEIAQELYKNLEDVLKKLVPKRQAETA